MKTLEEKLEQASKDVRHQIAQMPARPSGAMRGRSRRHRVAPVVAGIAFLLAVVAGAMLFLAGNAQTTPLSALPILGLDLPSWIPTDATEEESAEGGYRAISYYLPSEGGEHPLVVAKLRLRGIPVGSPHESGRWWMNRTDYETVTVRGHEARLFTSEGDYEVVWRESDQVVVELSVLSGEQSVKREQALSVANATTTLSETEWARMLLLKDVIPAGPTTTATVGNLSRPEYDAV